MLLEHLTLEDVGTYKGRQTFELTPRKHYGVKRPVILFGGLNGAGKTTFLLAVRLALYGRQSVGFGTTQKEYERFLRDLIHRPKHSLVRPTQAAISLEFIHSRFGVRDRYKVLRSWEEQGRSGVEERLRVFRSGEADEILTGEQAQSFLNQLIPSGVSQFFFFDGERIAALANDDSDVVLADAIRRLLGLDVAERLGADLGVYLRQLRASRADSKTREEVERLQSELDRLNQEVEDGESRLIGELTPALDAAKAEFARKRTGLSDRGGAWAVNRDELETELDRIRRERRDLEDRMRELLGGVAVFALAPRLGAQLAASLQREQEQAERLAVAKSIQAQVDKLKERIVALEGVNAYQGALARCVDGWVDELCLFTSAEESEALHGLIGGDVRASIESLTSKARSASEAIELFCRSAMSFLRQEDEVQAKLAHAPSDESLKGAFDELSKAAEDVATLQARRKAFIEDLKRKTWICIDLVRKLKKLEARVVEEGSVEQGELAAASLLNVIADFKLEAAKEKCEILRGYFVSAFLRLARKGDIVHDVRIDSGDFSVTLLDRAGREVPKKRLSAGEKQIYAIAMLEALAKTSGRSLPIIIDTPLGRLDSKHRNKLVESYFPVASHQVIILSTDTEVDLQFYEGMRKHISHAYHLSFDHDEGATQVEEGYFWKWDQEAVHAS